MAEIVVLRAGPLLTVQDLGRPAQRRAGISPGGALDQHAARIANLLVGNADDAALLEITLGPVRLRFADTRVVACCGAADGISSGKPLLMKPGEVLELRAPARGCRSWLAIAGGIDVPPVLGSRSTDLRGGFGGFHGRALRDGDELPLGQPSRHLISDDKEVAWSSPTAWAQPAAAPPVLRVVPGSERDDFGSEFSRETFRVTALADRMGARLEGAKISRNSERELLSEAVAPGTIQIAHDGQPILLLGDCQTLGGYPKIAHVITVDLPRAAQLRPNDTVRFQSVTTEDAEALFAERELDLARFRVGLQLLRP